MSGNLWMFSDKLDDEDIEIMKLVKYLQRLSTASDAQNALKTDNTTRPHSGGYGIAVAAVTGIALAEGRAGGKHGPIGHKPLSYIRNISGQLDPLIFAQTFHVAFLLVK